MAHIPVFGLLTDFGYDFAIASMKALLIKSLPNCQVIDIDHSISKFNIVSGNFIIEKTHSYFPYGTIFVCIIDPGVGSAREALCIETKNYTFFGPNNGLFTDILKREDVLVYSIHEQIIKPESYTFHGRDLFIPAAIAHAQGRRDFLVPLAASNIMYLDKKQHVIAYIDSFGNIKTTLPVDGKLITQSHVTLAINDETYRVPFANTFSDRAIGELLCYKGSNGTLELAVNLGSAQNYLNALVGDVITFVPQKETSR